MKKVKDIGIVGAGLIGSMLAILLARRGYRVSLFDRRADGRTRQLDAGRSINLALSDRGLRALGLLGLTEEVRALAIPMHGRMMHDPTGRLSFLPYGKEGQFINSVSRNGLNAVLLDQAEKSGATIFFSHRCISADIHLTRATFQKEDGEAVTRDFDLLIGADGVFSAVRSAMQVTDRFNYSQHYLDHGYKELQIPATPEGGFRLEQNALHIWPRESFMMIALPNPDRTFTCTLFLPFEGSTSFRTLGTDIPLIKFFSEVFPDAQKIMPHLTEDFRTNPTSSLVTIKCYPWTRNNTLLIGDAAHGIVPFYGQGMNAGFEDCRILNELLDQYNDNWDVVMTLFQEHRKPDTDAIAELAFDNFLEMRDLVADPSFILRKRIEARLHDLYPDRWIPLYTMVTFRDDIPYSAAQRTGRKQNEIMDRVMATPDIEKHWQELDFKQIVDQLD